MKVKLRYLILLCLWVLFASPDSAFAQNDIPQTSFFTPSDTFNQNRFKTALVISTVTYSAFSVGLYQTWYKKYPQQSFHLFNDWNEWQNIDKVGHFYTAYLQGVLCYKGAKWTGLSDNKSILVGAICGSLFQSTIEVMDGFSTNWGFSIPDIAANTLGIGAFAIQQRQWGEQRISFKVSSWPQSYPDHSITSLSGNHVTTLNDRADELYGSSFAERYLKDYNAQAYWASINISSFLSEDNKFPKWLNLALGYGVQNLYGGFENKWEVEDGNGEPINDYYVLDNKAFPRYHQFYIGMDLDLGRIKTDNYFLKGLLSCFNIFKAPSPAIEINSLGEIKFHLFR